MYNVISLHWESNPGSSVYKTDPVSLSHGGILLMRKKKRIKSGISITVK